MTIPLAGIVAFFHFIFYPNYLRWLDLRKYRKLGLVMPKVAGLIECQPCKVTALADQSAYLRGECTAGIPAQTGELISLQPSSGEKTGGLFPLEMMCFAVMFVLALFVIIGFAKTTLTLLTDLFQEKQELKKNKVLDGLVILKSVGKEAETYKHRYEIRFLEMMGCEFREKTAKPYLL